MPVVTLIVAIGYAYWDSAHGFAHLFWVIIGFAVFAVTVLITRYVSLGSILAAIAVPANATSRQRWMTIEAFRRAGVEVLSGGTDIAEF